jgi:hypothetical protein
MNIQTRRKVRDHNAPTMGKSVQAMARKGRAGDTEAGHLTKGEVVVPKRVWEADPGLQQRAMSAMMQAGLNPAQYIVGHPANSRNPQTGAREFADLAYVNGQWVNSGTGQAADFGADQNSFANTGTYSSQPQAVPRPGNAMSAAAPQDTRDWGADPTANQELARITGYQGDFGTGGFSTYMQGANDVQKQNAAQYLADQGRGQRIDWNTGMVAPVDDGAANNYGSPVSTFGYTPTGQGENPNNRAANQELAGLGYTGDFGGGGFNQWIGGQSADIQQQAANILARNNQPERIQDWGGNGFLNESPYINGTVPVGYTTPPAPPASGPTQPLGQGFNTFDFGTGQDQIKNFKAYFDQYGQVPVASGFTPENNQSFGIYDPRPNFGGAWDPTYSMIANLSPEDFAGLARSIGVDPNSHDAWLAIENAFGQRTMTYGDLVRDANGNYSWSNPQGSEVASALERGYMRIGSGPNSIEVPIADLISGKYSVNAVDLALSGGYDPNGMEGSTNTLDAAQQIMREIPGLANTRWNSAEYNTIRKPIEAATPGFNQQVGNRIARQQADGRSIPGGNTVGPTNLSSVISGANLGGYTPPGTAATPAPGTTAAANRTPTAMSASATPSGQSILDYSNNAAGWDRGSQLITMGSGGNFSMWKHPDGTIYHSDANGEWVLEPVGNGLYRDTMYGVLRNSGGVVVNPDGSPVVTQYSAQNHPGGTTSVGRLYGSSGVNQMLGSFAGVDLSTLRDGNNTPIRGNYGGGRPPTSGGVSTTPVPLPSPGGGTGGGGTGGTGGGGTTVPTSTGTGLTPGTTNPYSLPYGINLNIFGQGGQQSTGTNTQAATQQQYDPYSWLSLLNLGYGSSTYGQPTYTSADPNQAGGINYVQPNSQNVEFRTPFAYS